MDLVNLAYQFSIGLTQRNRFIVDSGSVQIQNLALPRDRQSVFFINYRLALAPSMRPSAMDEKSFSIDSWPILA
jgi:hypothetical protein